MTTIGYVRCSTQEQADSGLGIESQKQRIEAYASMRGIDLAEILVDEGVSGGKPLGRRPAGGELVLRTARRPRPDGVVMLKLDRGFRNAGDCLNTVDAWDKKGVALHIVDLGGNAIDTTSAAGRFMLVVLAGAAEMERNLTRERTRDAMAVKRQNGERITRVDRCQFGWQRDPNNPARLIENPEEQEVVKLIWRNHRAGVGPREIARKLEDAGIRCRGARIWYHTTVRSIIDRRQKLC